MYKIVHIARPVAGVGVYINLLVNHIDNKNFQSFLICNEQDNNIEIKDKSQKTIPQFYVNLIREINVFKDIKCLYQIIRLLRKINPDLIHCHSAKAGFLGRIAGAYLKIPTVYTPHAFSYLSSKNKLKRTLFRGVEKLFRLLPSKIIACSLSEYNRAVNDLKFKKNKLYIWNNSVEDNIDLKPSKLLEMLPSKFICSIGRPSYQKNIEMLIETTTHLKKNIKDIHLVLMGIGLYSPTIDKIKKIINENDLTKNITLIPWLERAEMMSILKASYMYVSSSRYEGLPYAIIEALSLAKPCVVTNVDGNKDLIINNYNGYLVELGKGKTMSEKIISIFNNIDIAKTMSENSRKEYENKYDIKKNIYNIEKIYITEIGKSS